MLRNPRLALLLVSVCLAAGSAGLAQTPNPDKEAYFGETHVHTGWSFDAYIFGNTKTNPADAYKYAIGETIKHPARLRHQDRDSARLDGSDRPLRVRRRRAARQHTRARRSRSSRLRSS